MKLGEEERAKIKKYVDFINDKENGDEASRKYLTEIFTGTFLLFKFAARVTPFTCHVCEAEITDVKFDNYLYFVCDSCLSKKIIGYSFLIGDAIELTPEIIENTLFAYGVDNEEYEKDLDIHEKLIGGARYADFILEKMKQKPRKRNKEELN